MKKINSFTLMYFISLCAFADPYVEFSDSLEAKSSLSDKNWRYDCTKDKFNDFKGCWMVKFNNSGIDQIKLETLKGLGVTVSFGLNDDPRIKGKVRVDQYKVETYHDSVIVGSQAARIIKQMQGGKSVTVQTQNGQVNKGSFLWI